MSNPTITDSQIRTFRAEASAAGDTEAAHIAAAPLGEEDCPDADEARAMVAQMIADAAAMSDDE